MRMTTSPDTRTPVARLRGPAELAAALPHLCGFVPTESLVLVSLHGPRQRVGLTLRADLPAPAHEEPLVADLVDRLIATGARAALVVLCTGAADEGDDLPRARLVARLLARLRSAGVTSDDPLLVRDGRWASYVCRDPRCCPRSGTPLAKAADSRALSLVSAEATTRGVAVLPSRDQLVARLAAPPPTDEVLDALSEAGARRRSRTASGGRAQAGRVALSAWRRALADAPPVVPTLRERAELVAGLDDVVVRDAVLTLLLDDDDALLWLLLTLAGQTPSPHDVQVCTLLGWTAHARGDGALANVALDRALTSDPGCTLALLARQALDGQVPPAELRSLTADSRAVLHAVHPWTASG